MFYQKRKTNELNSFINNLGGASPQENRINSDKKIHDINNIKWERIIMFKSLSFWRKKQMKVGQVQKEMRKIDCK